MLKFQNEIIKKLQDSKFARFWIFLETMKSRRIIYALKNFWASCKVWGSPIYLFPLITRHRFDNVVIEQPRGRARGTRSRLDRKSLSCLCISQRDTLSDSLYIAYTDKVYGFRQLSIYTYCFPRARCRRRLASITKHTNFPQDGQSWLLYTHGG